MDDIEDCSEAVKRVASNVAILKVVTDPPGATLYLGRKDLGQRGAGPETLGLAAGTYTVKLTVTDSNGLTNVVSHSVTICIARVWRRDRF